MLIGISKPSLELSKARKLVLSLSATTFRFSEPSLNGSKPFLSFSASGFSLRPASICFSKLSLKLCKAGEFILGLDELGFGSDTTLLDNDNLTLKLCTLALNLSALDLGFS